MKTNCVQLQNGLKMPLLGIGCRAGRDQRDVASVVETALLHGYRHVDTAFAHDNEQQVGAGIQAALNSGRLSRSDVFVVSKLPMPGMRAGKVEAYLRRSLELLNLEYVDLYLIQHPVGLMEEGDEVRVPQNAHANGIAQGRKTSVQSVQRRRKSCVVSRTSSLQPDVLMSNRDGNMRAAGDRRRTVSLNLPRGYVTNGFAEAVSETDWSQAVVSMDSDKLKLDLATDLLAVWRDMEHLVRLGLANSIGVCNFNSRQLTKLVAAAEIPPAVLQIECHAYLQQRDLRRLCERHNIAVTAFGALGSPGRRQVVVQGGVAEPMLDLLRHPVVRLVALRYRRTSAQVLFRFMVQQNITVIPKATSERHIKENSGIFNFKLDEVDMAALETLDRGEIGRYFHFKDAFPGYEQHPEYPF